MNEEKSKQQVLEEALYKRALGYLQDEIVEEYSPLEDGTFKLSKRKVTKKVVSPDISAAKVLLQHFLSKESMELSSMTDEELEQEKNRLLKLLEEAKD